ncbi:MAG: hypothetical protein AAF648_00215 [Pseudomonadota bacterium]
MQHYVVRDPRLPTLARNELGPLLDRLIAQLDEEGRATQRACFQRIRRRLDLAQDDTVLSESITALCTSANVGFSVSSASQPLLDRLVEKAAAVSEGLGDRPAAPH